MASRGLLISQTFFYENSPVDENVDWKVIRPIVWECQEIFIQSILGTPLYQALKDEIVANGGALTTERFVTLVDDHVAQCLSTYVMSEVQVTLLFKFRNQSVLKGRTPNDDTVDFPEHKYLKDVYRIKAEKFAGMVELFLIANIATYPEYQTYTSVDQVRAEDQGPSTSLFLSGNGRNCNELRKKGHY